MTESNEIVIMSWDIGEKNLACYKTRFNRSQLEELKRENVPHSQRYYSNGECTPKFAQLLQKLGTLGQRLFISKTDLTKPDDKKIGRHRIITSRILVRMNNYLEDLNKDGVFDDVSYCVIEKQLSKASNNRELQYHLRAYFLMLFLTFRPIIMFPSKWKTIILGAPKKIFNQKTQRFTKITQVQRKKWACDQAFQMLTDRNDMEGLSHIFTKKRTGKADDVCDCIIQSEAFVYMVFIDGKKDLLDC